MFAYKLPCHGFKPTVYLLACYPPISSHEHGAVLTVPNITTTSSSGLATDTHPQKTSERHGSFERQSKFSILTEETFLVEATPKLLPFDVLTNPDMPGVLFIQGGFFNWTPP